MATNFNPASLVPGTIITGGTTVIYTAPALTTVKISQLTLFNSDAAAAHKVLIYLASNAAAPATKDFLAVKVLAPLQTISVYEAIDQVLAPGATIQAQADMDSFVNLKASGLLIT